MLCPPQHHRITVRVTYDPAAQSLRQKSPKQKVPTPIHPPALKSKTEECVLCTVLMIAGSVTDLDILEPCVEIFLSDILIAACQLSHRFVFCERRKLSLFLHHMSPASCLLPWVQ